MSRTGKHENVRDGSTKTTETDRNRPSEEAIRVRAFEKFRARNGGPGDPVTDWVEAEREIREESATVAASKH
jgi:hypothetical protein